MKTHNISIKDLKQESDNIFSRINVLHDELEDVQIDHFTLKGDKVVIENPSIDYYDVVFVLYGEATANTKNCKYALKTGTIIKIPFNEQYLIHPNGDGVHFLRIRKALDNDDLGVISQKTNEHSSVFVSDFEDCPVYTEDIKSSKSINRMILPEGKVPRFCMGAVETEGPDLVAEHEHPMLDQLFFGLKGCKCTCKADGESQLLIENMMLHIPLGSKHSVSVADGEKLAYIWLDFFLTLEGQKYMNEQHRMDD